MGSDAGLFGIGPGAALGVFTAMENNRALEASARSAAIAERRELQQLSNRETAERAARIRRSQRLRGRIRAVAGERGTGITGSDVGLLNQNAIDTARNDGIARQNTAFAAIGVRSGTSATIAQLDAQHQNPIIAGIQGALGGAQAGLSLSSYLGAGRPAPENDPLDIPEP